MNLTELKIIGIIKRIVLIALIFSYVFVLSGCSDSNTKQDKEKITFVLDWTPNTNHTGVYVALEKGYFEEAGLDVKIVQPPEDGAEALVASGKAQFGVSFQDSLAPAFSSANALPITAVAAMIQHNTSGVISRKGEGLDRPNGLVGKNYATWDMPVEKAMLQDVVETDGGDFSKVNLIPSTVSDEVTALRTKAVDAIWIFYAWAGISTEVNELETDYFEFREINPVFDYYTPVIIANNEHLNQHQDTAKAFLNAVKKGYEDAIADPSAAAAILIKQVPELDADLVNASQKWISSQYKSEVERWGYFDAERWNAFYNWLNDNDLVEEDIPEGTGFTNDYLPE